MNKLKFAFLALAFGMTAGCAFLHHVQVGEIDSTQGRLVPFDILISETGVNLNEIRGATRAALGTQRSKEADDAMKILALFQMGPRTGNPVYVKDYAKNLLSLIYERCPSGQVTGLTSIRETRKYPVVSGEIVKVTGFCVMPKGS